MSPSIRKAWIEIKILGTPRQRRLGRLPYGRRGLKSSREQWNSLTAVSPSIRKAWIEIKGSLTALQFCKSSPSIRKAWIEITTDLQKSTKPTSRLPYGRRGLKSLLSDIISPLPLSPSIRKAWIEIGSIFAIKSAFFVAFHTEGVD